VAEGCSGQVRSPTLLILGPLALRHPAGASVGPAGLLPRRLLAGLAIYAGEVVSPGRLADFVWGADPPRSARSNLHTYMWSWRRCLSAAGSRISIETEPGGYVLRAEPGALDWDCFRDLVDAARISRSEPTAAAALLHRALGLWRGPAAPEFDDGPPELTARLAAMEEARIGALEQRIEADLAAGRHHELAAELSELTARYPLREQFRAHQMVALYRSGRQAEAMAAFRQLRRELAAELGVDPSPPLPDLYRAILRADPDICWPPPAMAHRQAERRGALDRDTMASSLIGRLVREIADPELGGLLQAASLVHTFSRDLLAAVLGRDVAGSYDALCAMSFVQVVRHGARLHDLVRESVAADLRDRAPEAYRAMRHRARAHLAKLASTSAEPGPYVQELLHLAAGTSARARFYAPGRPAGVRIRQVRPDDLPRLTELCYTGITRFGLPSAERARELAADFPVAQRRFVVAMGDHDEITGFAYTIGLHHATWRAVASTRKPFFATLPASELASIRTASERAPAAVLVTGATHLPGHDYLGPALRKALIWETDGLGANRPGVVAYHLLTPDCLELPEIVAAGWHVRRKTGIRLENCAVDEWLIRHGSRDFVGLLATALPDSGAVRGDRRM
jgi:DNA-binding SARP family transcriptional activator